jgi:hypothetical protein
VSVGGITPPCDRRHSRPPAPHEQRPANEPASTQMFGSGMVAFSDTCNSLMPDQNLFECSMENRGSMLVGAVEEKFSNPTARFNTIKLKSTFATLGGL